MTRQLPPHPSLTHLRNQARDLCQAQRRGDSAVCAVLRHHPRFAGASDAEILAAAVTLAEAQHALAKDYGCANWRALRAQVLAGAPATSPAPPPEPRRQSLANVTIRPMTVADLPALRRYDDEMTAWGNAEINAQSPPEGHGTCAGGPWSNDAEMAAHFAKYQRHGGTTLLAEDAGRVVGFADLWPAREPPPFGASLDVECIDYFHAYFLAGIERLLLSEAEQVARAAGLPALDIGTNTCSSEFASLRRFGLRVFYEYDDLRCRCRPVAGPRPARTILTPATADLTDLIKASHWSPTDFAHRGEDERTYLAELRWPDWRAIIELWHYAPDHDDLPVPPNPPNRSELFVPPAALTSPTMLTGILAECAAIAGELGAAEIELPCPSDLEPEADRLATCDRRFAFAWLRKRLR